MPIEIVDGVRYSIKKITATNVLEQHEKRTRTCGLTRKLIQSGDKISLIMNNDVAFPNKWVMTDALEEMGVDSAIRYLKQRYADYKAFQNEFSEWI